jgi:hypothetical protein
LLTKCIVSHELAWDKDFTDWKKCRFDLRDAKADVIKELGTILPMAVKKYMMQPQFDQFVKTCLLYFVAVFQQEYLRAAVDKAVRQQGEVAVFDPITVEAKLAQLQQEADDHRKSLSPLYALVCCFQRICSPHMSQLIRLLWRVSSQCFSERQTFIASLFRHCTHWCVASLDIICRACCSCSQELLGK